ncbi:helix-turn-helix transcriptional regulator [Streptomyces actuosus]|uniref:Helix-turn-helix transcriptional regulator n=1 Tax=Streptomyces actuosus TaxID=1885 RepID=A0ABS2VXS5_STRAS|nr:helix-turn-helix transcriptional regulator [Streptomyces actuosus]MBN0047811.1 helix-turn-helix transcriptional regulator [Streptomyces actuosus]
MWQVHQSSAPPNQPGPPFNAPAARRLRAALGMGPEHVAHGMRVSYGLTYVTPDLVVAWERGIAQPGNPELTALAGVLWCAPGELIGRPRSLREHRIAAGVAPEDVARAAGMDLRSYLRMEESDQWRGNERQAAALSQVLRLSLPDFVAVTGREQRLAELLRSAATTRWQGYVKPVGKVAPVARGVLEQVLQGLHEDYQGHMAATLSWGGGSSEASESGRVFLDRIVENFWTAVRQRTG